MGRLLSAGGKVRMNLYLMRHGRTASNAMRQHMGKRDVPLDECGLLQAEQAAETLSGLALDIVYSSPLRRARATAEVVVKRQGDSGRSVPLHLDERLVEMDFGDAAGAEKRQKLDVRGRHRRIALPGGESLLDVWSRADSFSRKLVEGGGSTVLVVAHHRVLQVLAGVLSGLDFDRATDTVRVAGLRNGTVHYFRCRLVHERLYSAAPTAIFAPNLGSI